MSDRKTKTFSGIGPCSECEATHLTITAAGGIIAHGPRHDRCPGSGKPPRGSEAPPLVAALTPPSEPAPSPGEPVAPASLPPVGSVVRVGSPDSEPGRVVRHVGGSFTLRWEDGEEGGGYLPADIVPDLEAPAAEVSAAPPSEPATTPADPPTEPDELPEGVARLGLPVERREDDRAAEQWRAAALRALLPDGAELTQTAAGWALSWDGATRPAACLSDLVCDLMADAFAVTPARSPDYQRFIAGMCQALHIEPPGQIAPIELQQGAGFARRSLHSEAHQADVIRAILPTGANLTALSPGWRLDWPQSWGSSSIVANDLKDLITSAMIDGAPSVPRTAAPDCEAQRRRIAVLEGQLDSSREEVGRLTREINEANSWGASKAFREHATEEISKWKRAASAMADAVQVLATGRE